MTTFFSFSFTFSLMDPTTHYTIWITFSPSLLLYQSNIKTHANSNGLFLLGGGSVKLYNYFWFTMIMQLFLTHNEYKEKRCAIYLMWASYMSTTLVRCIFFVSICFCWNHMLGQTVLMMNKCGKTFNLLKLNDIASIFVRSRWPC